MYLFRSALMQEGKLKYLSCSQSTIVLHVTQCTHCRHHLWLLPASTTEARGYHQSHYQELEGFI